MISIEEQKEELESLKKEVDQLKRSLSKEVGDGGDLEKEVAKINREYEEVIKDMDRMRIDFREKSNLVGDCENLQMMIGYVKGDIEGKKGRMKVVEQDMAKAEERKKEVEKELEVLRKKQDEERRARLVKASLVNFISLVRVIANWEKPGEEMPSSIAEIKKIAEMRK